VCSDLPPNEIIDYALIKHQVEWNTEIGRQYKTINHHHIQVWRRKGKLSL
jgi:hypothetical protein